MGANSPNFVLTKFSHYTVQYMYVTCDCSLLYCIQEVAIESEESVHFAILNQYDASTVSPSVCVCVCACACVRAYVCTYVHTVQVT